MTTYIGSAEAARLLGVSLPTLYAYVSRGRVRRRTAADGRTSLFALDEIETLRRRARSGPLPPRPSIDVQITTSVTSLHEEGSRYRGHDAVELARTVSFEQVAELLWTGELPATATVWPAPSPDEVAEWRSVLGVAGLRSLPALQLLAMLLAGRHGAIEPAAAGRLLITLVPAVLGPPPGPGTTTDGPVAAALAGMSNDRPSQALVEALDRALVLLADHELATSTLAVRIAGSVRADPFTAFAAGLAVLHAPLHGSAAAACCELLQRAREIGVASAVGAALARGQHLPGFGHRVYREVDPRFPSLLESVRALPDPQGRLGVVDELLLEAGRRVTVHPNVDLALGALHFVGQLPADLPVFAVARLAGWAAHLEEEYAERPLRFRGMARPPQPAGPP